MLEQLAPEDAADIIEALPDVQAAGLLEEMLAERAASIVEELPSNDRADILGQLGHGSAEAILEEMAPEQADGARQLLQYPHDTAGGILVTKYLAFEDSATVGQVLADIRDRAAQYSDYEVQYLYITDRSGRLVGVLPIRNLLLSSSARPIREAMIPDPLAVAVGQSLDDLRHFFSEHHFLGVPVTDEQGRLVGIVSRDSVRQAAEEEAHGNFLKVSGISEEELRSMPLLRRSRRRLSWLSINIGLNLIAASIIAVYRDTLQEAITLAVFLPIISDMSGCSGNQSVAVSIRELTLGLIKPYEFLRVFAKEAGVGVLNGLCLGLLLGAVAFIWKGNPWLGAVVGTAMALNTLLAVVLGGLIPLALRSVRADPALASGPILTTVTDMCGFFFVLSFASAVLPKLAGV